MNSQEAEHRSKPTSVGRVAGVASDHRHRFSKSAQQSVVLLKGIGVEGDAHSGPFVRHRYLARHSPNMPNMRQVHLIPAELLEALRTDGCDHLGPGDLGENVLTSGLNLETLPLRTILRFGDDAAVELTGLRTPCVLIDRFRAGLKRKLIVSKSGHPPYRCGVMGVVRSGGQVSVGDRIAIKFPPESWTVLPAL